MANGNDTVAHNVNEINSKRHNFERKNERNVIAHTHSCVGEEKCRVTFPSSFAGMRATSLLAQTFPKALHNTHYGTPFILRSMTFAKSLDGQNKTNRNTKIYIMNFLVSSRTINTGRQHHFESKNDRFKIKQ